MLPGEDNLRIAIYDDKKVLDYVTTDLMSSLMKTFNDPAYTHSQRNHHPDQSRSHAAQGDLQVRSLHRGPGLERFGAGDLVGHENGARADDIHYGSGQQRRNLDQWKKGSWHLVPHRWRHGSRRVPDRQRDLETIARRSRLYLDPSSPPTFMLRLLIVLNISVFAALAPMNRESCPDRGCIRRPRRAAILSGGGWRTSSPCCPVGPDLSGRYKEIHIDLVRTHDLYGPTEIDSHFSSSVLLPLLPDQAAARHF